MILLSNELLQHCCTFSNLVQFLPAVGGPLLNKHYINVVIKVKEKRRFHGSIVAHAGNQVGDAVSVCVHCVVLCYYCQRYCL